MATYVYRAADGSTIEREGSMHSPPPIGARKWHEGKVYRRIPNLPQPKVRPNYHFESRSLPRWWPHAKQHGPDGKPRFGSRREIQETEARSAHSEHDAVKHGEL